MIAAAACLGLGGWIAWRALGPRPDDRAAAVRADLKTTAIFGAMIVAGLIAGGPQ